jgi:hypothetical protein
MDTAKGMTGSPTEGVEECDSEKDMQKNDEEAYTR